jgi:hypothetical protein
MAKPKGKTPSLLSMSTGTPEIHSCGKSTACERCNEKILMGNQCFKIPKQKSGFTAKPLFCTGCTKEIIQQTKLEIEAIESLL